MKNERCHVRVAISQNSSTTCGTMARRHYKGMPLCRKHFRMVNDSLRSAAAKEVTLAIVRRAASDHERRQRKRNRK